MLADGTWAKQKNQSTRQISDLCSDVHFSDKFGFKELFDAINRACDVMIDSCD